MGIFRLIIWAGLIYLGYRIIKNRILPNISLESKPDHPPSDAIDDLMVKDPVCEVYFPKKNGFHVRIDGHDYYFCSKECRNRFLAERSKQ